MADEISSGLQDALGKLLREEQAKEGRKKKPAFKVPVEKRKSSLPASGRVHLLLDISVPSRFVSF